ncbi:MAG: S8 family serine peptidase [Paenibacillus sp.]|nr:S8 family serine peptidase [Paenibacillus sp.]
MLNKFASTMLVAIMLMASLFTGKAFASSEQEGSNNYIEGQLVVSIEAQPGAYSIQSIDDTLTKLPTLANKGFSVADSLFGDKISAFAAQPLDSNFKAMAIQKMGMVYLVEYNVADYASLDAAKEALGKVLSDGGFQVRYISENRKMSALETATVLDVSAQAVNPNQTWNYNMIKVPQAWEITTGSTAVKIGVLDSGIDSNHPSLSNFVNTSLGRSFVGGTTMDGFGHGTHVAGTIASYGSVSGVMQSASLIPIRVLGNNGLGSLYGIQQGIVYAVSIKCDVINMSLGGGGYDQGMDDAVQTAVSAGVTVVAATGNDGVASISYPAAYNNTIAVGSVTSSRTRSSLSNYGSGLDIVAPGSNIYSTVPNGQYQLMSGTSMATPHVTGVVGLMKAVNPSLTPAQVESILKSTAQPAGSAYEYGSGIVDAYAAVQAANGGGNPQPDKQTQTTVQTDKSVYQRGDNINITSKVVNQQGSALQGASVNFTLTRPNGTTITNAAATNSSGVATWSITSNAQTALGSYQVKAESTLSGYQSSSATSSLQFSDGGGVDTQAPSVPSNLTSTGKTNTSVSLSWGASTDNVGVTGYEVYQGNSLVTTVTMTSSTVTGLTPNTAYTFTVKAKDAAGNISAASNAVSVTTNNDATPPNPNTPWALGVAYNMGDLVSYGGSTYQCLQAHTSLTGWEPTNVPALWLKK